MSRWFTYIVRCGDGTLYTGVTVDLARRLRQHNDGLGAKYTRSRRPVVLVWSRRERSESVARRREAAIKKMTREQKMTMVGAN